LKKKDDQIMTTSEQIQQALTQVIDPELGRDIVELGMVRAIHVDGGEVSINLALTMQGCPLKGQLKAQTQAAAAAVPGVERVHVELTTMTPVEREQLKERLSNAVRMNRIGHVVAVMSGKGGVGKSSVTALMAAALERRGLTVGVMDADLTGPSIPRLFGIAGPVPATPMGMLPIETQTGIKVISTNLMLQEEDMAVLWRGPIMSGTIRQFWKDVLWGRLDYLLIDLPPGTSDATITVMQSLPLDGVVMVTTPQSLSSMVVRKTVNMCRELKIPILGIVENMSYFVSPETGTRHRIFGPSHTRVVADLAEAPVMGELPIDPALTELADAGEIERYEGTETADLAAAFLQAIPPVEPAPAAPWMQS
jgi:Mrp family chromosome partitioning ATPase